MSEQTQLFLLTEQPVTDDPITWHTYWKMQGQPWRTMPKINEGRETKLAKLRATVSDIERGIYPFKDIKLSRADIEWLLATHENGRGLVDWSNEDLREREGLDLRGADLRGVDLSGLPLTRLRGGLSVRERGNMTPEQHDMATVHLEGANLIRAHLEGAFLFGAHLEGANLIRAHLEGAFLYGAHLEGANLFESHLQGANLSFARLEEVNLIRADLEEANLSFAHLEGALLSEAWLKRAKLVMADLEGTNLIAAHLAGAYLQRASFDAKTILERAILGNGKHEFISLADVHWGDVDLTAIDWLSVKMLGDEHEARERKVLGGKVKGEVERLAEYKAAVRANRQLTLVLRSQGLNEEADHFAYRAQLLQRIVWRRQGRPLKYIFSWFLYVLAGYGYRPLLSLLIYFLMIVSFAVGFYGVTHALHVQLYPLTWYEALVLSISSFHGRGFFQPAQSLGDPVGILAALEAVVGLLIEISFVATFTQRFLGK